MLSIVTMKFVDSAHACSVLVALDTQRRESPDLCDVRLNVGGDMVLAHRCVLAATSGYFQTLFTGKFCDCRREECTIANGTSKTASAIVDFLYSGRITILPQTIEELLSLADYLCIEQLKVYCEQFMSNNITDDNCVFIKYLCEKFSLVVLSEELSKFISPRISRLLVQPDILTLPCDFIHYLLTNKDFNHVNEQQIFHFLMRWINRDVQNRIAYSRNLLNMITLDYLPKSFIRSRILTNGGVIPMREHMKKDMLDALDEHIAQVERCKSVDIIICRSRSVTMGQEVQLLSYLISQDSWHVLHIPEPHMLDGLESLVRHLDSIYFLVSKTEDMYGYMHHSQESKFFSSLNLVTCKWEMLPPPTLVKGSCRLVSHLHGVYAVDRMGLVEEFDCQESCWEALTAAAMFDTPSSTWYVLPMAYDRYLYVMRVFSAGYAFSFSQVSFSMHKLDTVHRTISKLAETEACELDLDDKEKLHSYIAHPGALVMRNELGLPRLNFDLSTLEFSTVKVKTRTPRFMTDVWGSVQGTGRVYLVAKSKLDSPTSMFYDCSRDRFKATAVPPTYLSGLMCHVTLSKESWEKLVEELP